MPYDVHDQDLLARCISNEEPDAWELFVRKYSNLIWSSLHRTFHAYSYPYSTEDIEDAYGAIFLSLLEHDFRKLRQFEGRNACTLSTWLTVVAVRHAVDHMRRQKKHGRVASLEDESRLLDTAADTRHDLERDLTDRQTSAALATIVAGLKPEEQKLFGLLSDDRHSPEETARALKISVATFYTRKHRLIEKVKKMMKGR